MQNPTTVCFPIKKVAFSKQIVYLAQNPEKDTDLDTKNVKYLGTRYILEKGNLLAS